MREKIQISEAWAAYEKNFGDGSPLATTISKKEFCKMYNVPDRTFRGWKVDFESYRNYMSLPEQGRRDIEAHKSQLVDKFRVSYKLCNERNYRDFLKRESDARLRDLPVWVFELWVEERGGQTRRSRKRGNQAAVRADELPADAIQSMKRKRAEHSLEECAYWVRRFEESQLKTIDVFENENGLERGCIKEMYERLIATGRPSSSLSVGLKFRQSSKRVHVSSGRTT